MTDEQIADARRFITGLFGEPLDEEWWMSEEHSQSSIGKTGTGWCLTIHDDMLAIDWADLTPDDVLVKLYAVIGWAVMNAVILDTPLYTLVPPYKTTLGTIQHVESAT